MDIQINTIDNVTIVALTGEINGRNAPEVQEQLMPLAEPGCKILLNMGGINYMSSAGLRTLLMLYRQIDRQSGCGCKPNEKTTREHVRLRQSLLKITPI